MEETGGGVVCTANLSHRCCAVKFLWAIIFFGLVGYAEFAGHWNADLPKQVYLQLVPKANEQQHPMPGSQ